MQKKEALKLTINQKVKVTRDEFSPHGFGHSIPVGSVVRVDHTYEACGRVCICLKYKNYTQTVGHKAIQLHS